MKIDKHPIEMTAMDEFKKGNNLEANKIQDAFVKEFLESVNAGESYCPCAGKCKWAGKCVECVAIHRGHADHLPACLEIL